ncbi:MAG: MaoC family dehydratase N-terminal domain-containing protein [Myxococcota bacterium]
MTEHPMIGRETPPGEAQAAPDEIARFCEAVGDIRSEYADVSDAKVGTIGAVIAPPTFPMRFLFDALEPDLFFDLGLNLAGIVHAEQEFIYERPVRAGESYAIAGKVFDVWEKQGRSGPLDFVTFEARGLEKKSGELVFTARMTLISRRLEE